MKIIKRDGIEVLFDSNKIVNAVLKAFKQVDGKITKEAQDIATQAALSVHDVCKKSEHDLNISEIQHIVEHVLMSSSRKDVATAYIEYRSARDREREKNSKLFKEYTSKIHAKDIQNQNANMDEGSFGGRKGEASNSIDKNYALNFLMSDMARENHLGNMIYHHDLDHYALGDHNCLTLPFDDLLSNGFYTRQADIRPANSASTAFQLVAVLFQLQSLQQFGGVAASHIDHTMVPYVRKSFSKHFKTGLKYIQNVSDEYLESVPEILSFDAAEATCKENSRAYEYARDMIEKEVQQAAEGMLHNLNTLQSRSGNQLPFTSVNYGTCTLPEGRLVTKAILEATIKGIGKQYTTSVFPCHIFQCMKGINRFPGDPNYDLFRLALKCTANRLYPNYCNVDWSVNAGYDVNDPKTYMSTIN